MTFLAISCFRCALYILLPVLAFSQDLVTVPDSPYGYNCSIVAPRTTGDLITDAGTYTIFLTSPTTVAIAWRDSALQRLLPYHPKKCGISAFGQVFRAGLLLLQNACHCKHSFNSLPCFRREHFQHLRQPDAETVEHQLFITGADFSVWPGSLIQPYALSQRWQESVEEAGVRGDVAALFQGEPAFEVCSFTGSCTPKQGLCQPAFWLVAELWNAERSYDAWENVTTTQFYPNVPMAVETAVKWEQVRHTKADGPFPHCPEVEGRAGICRGNETLRIRMARIEVKEAAVQEGGGRVVFDVRFTLEWDDRYAVHPCSVNLYGGQRSVDGEAYWAPNLTALNEKDPERVRSADARFGVNLGFGKPVTQALPKSGEGYVPWPKQLVLSREYEARYFPEPRLSYFRFPFDSQVLALRLAETKIPRSLRYSFELAPDAVSQAEVDVGDEWRQVRLGVKVVEEGGRDAFLVEVEVEREAMATMYTLMVPALSFVALDVVGHLTIPYDDPGQLFMAEALMVSTSIGMCSPQYLGVPANLARMPFMQCFNLMLVVGNLKTALLLLGRFFWTLRLKNDGDGQGTQRLQAQLASYDCFVKALVPLWYLLSLLSVAAYYGVL